MRDAPARPVLFGEVLFDHFPDGSEVLGGAPFNVAWHLRGFGESPLLLSRVGRDAAGARVRQAMRAWGLDDAGLQEDAEHPTGRVRITLDAGEPRFEILPAQAYDFIDRAGLPPLERPAFLYHGSLALRRAAARATLQAISGDAALPVFLDVNLRAPWWAAEDVLRWAGRAAWVKLNEAELGQLQPGAGGLEARARALQARCGCGVLVTRGEAGAWALSAEGETAGVRPAAAVRVVDTVGAGDAFAAVFLLGRLRGWPLAATLARAQDFASAIVGLRGATVAERGLYQAFLAAWGEGGQAGMAGDRG